MHLWCTNEKIKSIKYLSHNTTYLSIYADTIPSPLFFCYSASKRIVPYPLFCLFFTLGHHEVFPRAHAGSAVRDGLLGKHCICPLLPLLSCHHGEHCTVSFRLISSYLFLFFIDFFSIPTLPLPEYYDDLVLPKYLMNILFALLSLSASVYLILSFFFCVDIII